MNVTERVHEIVAEQLRLEPSEVSQGSNVTELGADSLHIVEMVVAIEDEFDIDIPDDDAQSLTTVGAMVRYVEQRLAPKDT